MRKFKFLPHSADLKLKVFGKTKKELFLNALSGMRESQKPEIKGNQKTKRIIQIKSLDFEALLVDFLSEALYFGQVNREIYNNIKFKKFTNTEIKGELSGFKVERFGEDIKAVTYHDIDIHQKENGSWEATILFDI